MGFEEAARPSCLVFGPITKCPSRVARKDSMGLMLAGQRDNVCRRAHGPTSIHLCAQYWRARYWGYLSPRLIAAPGPQTSSQGSHGLSPPPSNATL